MINSCIKLTGCAPILIPNLTKEYSPHCGYILAIKLICQSSLPYSTYNSPHLINRTYISTLLSVQFISHPNSYTSTTIRKMHKLYHIQPEPVQPIFHRATDVMLPPDGNLSPTRRCIRPENHFGFFHPRQHSRSLPITCLNTISPILA